MNTLEGKGCFVLEDVGIDAAVIKHSRLACTRCQPTITFNTKHQQHIIEHNGAHILFDHSIDCSMKPYGLCLHPTPLCKIYLKKLKGRMGNITINIRASSCPNLVKFSIVIAAEFSDASPCTNHPFRCPKCPDSSPVVWSYMFCDHLT